MDALTTEFLLDGPMEIAEYDGATDALLLRYVYGPGMTAPLAEVSATGSTRFLHIDAIGSVVAVTGDSAGSVVERYAYGPHGEGLDEGLGSIAFRYAGHRYDPETKLVYMRARFYSVAIGRFLSPDPIGYADGFNLYTYVANSPLNFIDPTGLAGANPPKGFEPISDVRLASIKSNAIQLVQLAARAIFEQALADLRARGLIDEEFEPVFVEAYANTNQSTGQIFRYSTSAEAQQARTQDPNLKSINGVIFADFNPGLLARLLYGNKYGVTVNRVEIFMQAVVPGAQRIDLPGRYGQTITRQFTFSAIQAVQKTILHEFAHFRGIQDELLANQFSLQQLGFIP